MGLDMFLTAKNKITKEEIDVGYWRKANEIHNWIIENVQRGNDNCKPHVVPRKKLEELKKICEIVLKSLNESETETREEGEGKYKYQLKIYKNTEIAEKLLPTQSGFFFGETRYTNFYKEDLEDTIRICNDALNLDSNYKIYYCSWW